MVVVDGFADSAEAEAHLTTLMPLLGMETSGTVH
tara:strand:+ start:487 stop:588 length:102 start_codon:yes stop_codon:yes gene_type:complete